ncbi:hypothetical protein HKD37_19G053729 [Glycine soja]
MQAKPFHVALHFANSSGKTGSMAFCQSRLRNRCSFFQVSPIGVVNPFHMGMHFANSRAKQVAAFSAWHFAIDVGGNRDGCSFFSGVANRGVISPVRMAKILVIKKKFTIPNGEMVGYILVYGEFGYNNLIFQWKENDGVIFEGNKKVIQIKRGIGFNALEKNLEIRFLVSGKYAALQICDDEDVETMIEIIELYIEKDVADGSTFHFVNSVRSCGNKLSNNESELPRNVSNLDDDDDEDKDDDDYLSLDEDDSVDGVEGIHNPFWNDALYYNNINWSHPNEEDICGLEMPSSFNVGQELYVGMDFDSKDAVKNAVKQYVMKVHQSFKVLESKSQKYIVCCPNKSAECPCPFYMREILSKKNDSWKVPQWGGPHTCLNMSVTQDHDKLDSDLIVTYVVGTINSEFGYKVSYKKAWMAKQKAISIEYGDWEESYAKISSWLKHMQNNSPGSYFQILHDDFIVGNKISREHCQFHRVFWTFGQCKDAFNYCKPIIQVDGTHLYGKYRGTLLMATSQDGNGGVLPLAFVVVEGETLTAWSWFLAHLREHVIDKNGICLISDRHASIKSVVANETLGWQPPHTYHVYCIRHITSNFNRKFNNAKQKEMFKKLAYIPCKHTFDQNFENFCQLSPAIATWIDRISKEKWTMAYDKEGRRYDYMTTNLSECINKYSALHYSCSHIIAACGYVSINYFQYEDVVYTNEHILKAYSAQWWPLGNEATISPSDDSWTLILDPSTIRAKGRPKSTRIRNEMD